MKKISLDVHTHTIMSGHAYSSLQEMVTVAQQKGLEILGITEHAPGIPGTCNPIYFRNLHVVPRQIGNLRLMLGAELNIMDRSGTVDLDEERLKYLDYAIASLHIECIRPGTKKENTEALQNAMKNPKVFIIGHPDDGTFEVDYELLAQSAAENHVLIELNEASVRPDSYRKNARKNAAELLSACKKHGTYIIISSDAHRASDVMRHGNALQLLEKMQFPEELIVNASADRLTKLLSLRNEKILKK